jgi:hypothetical protein
MATFGLDIDGAYVDMYRDGYQHQFQQATSRTRQYVTIVNQKAESDFYNRLGLAERPNKVTSRYGDTPLNDVPHDRRRIQTEDYDWAKLVDRNDLLRVLSDPSEGYQAAAAKSFAREIDHIIFDAAFGTADYGKEGENSISFVGTSSNSVSKGDGNTTEGIDIAVDLVASGGATNKNLTLEKLIVAREAVLSEEAMDQGQLAVMFVTANMLSALLRDEKLTSADYNTVRALVAGTVDTWMGFKFIHTELLPYQSGSSTIRDGLALAAPTAINLAVSKDVTVEVTPRPDKRNIPQIYMAMSMGASRMWGEQVVKIKCDETVK